MSDLWLYDRRYLYGSWRRSDCVRYATIWCHDRVDGNALRDPRLDVFDPRKVLRGHPGAIAVLADCAGDVLLAAYFVGLQVSDLDRLARRVVLLVDDLVEAIAIAANASLRF